MTAERLDVLDHGRGGEGATMVGLREKFRIRRVDGRPMPEGARYFVLRIDDDPHARAALRAYAASCAAENPALAADLTAALAETEDGR
jgi:hypothetical protein